MIDNFSSKKIQKDLYKITKKQFSIGYINKTIKVIFKNIVLSKKKKFLISGAQGCGKTTLLKLINENFYNFYNLSPLCISLDDYYLTKNQRVQLSNKIHPLFITRGVPGTHDIERLVKTINLFDKKKYPIKINKFDKLFDDRSDKIEIISSKKDIIILEGWCCNCSFIEKKYLEKNFNKIEKMDNNYIWRNYYNNKLKNEYRSLFNKFEYSIFLKIPSFKNVLDWRLNQEKQLLLNLRKKNNLIKLNDIKNFILYYEKITKWMLLKKNMKASLLINLDKNQKINKIIKKKAIF